MDTELQRLRDLKVWLEEKVEEWRGSMRNKEELEEWEIDEVDEEDREEEDEEGLQGAST